MAWTEQTASSVSYDKKPDGATSWDSGATLWDVSGNIEQTQWDLTSPTYTTQSAASVTWIEI